MCSLKNLQVQTQMKGFLGFLYFLINSQFLYAYLRSVWKRCFLLHKSSLFRHFFQTSRFDGSPFLGQLRWKRVIYLKRKPYNLPIERMFETWRISVMRGFIRVLVKVVLFQLRGWGHPQGDATPNFFPNSKSCLLGFSNEVSFVSIIFRESG